MNIILKCGECGAQINAKETHTDLYQDFTVTVETCECITGRLAEAEETEGIANGRADELQIQMEDLRDTNKVLSKGIRLAVAAIEAGKDSAEILSYLP